MAKSNMVPSIVLGIISGVSITIVNKYVLPTDNFSFQILQSIIVGVLVAVVGILILKYIWPVIGGGSNK